MRNITIKILTIGLCAAGLSMTGCGSTDGGSAGDENFEGTQFVPNEENSGRISVEVNEDQLGVSEITGFHVYVKDSAGQGVPRKTISCDSEEGVAIIEPTTGAETTDDFGQISGKIGCAAPGSFLFGCRLPVGGNIRQLVTIRCSGPIPTGFDGFAGAAGGGLSNGTGGVDTNDDGGLGGTDTSGIRITAIEANDTGADSADSKVQIDTVQDICSTDDPSTPEVEPTVYETFGDTFVNITVTNNTNAVVRFTSLKYNVPGVGTSSTISFIGEAEVGTGGTGTLSAIIFSANGPGSDDKFVIKGGGGSNIPLKGSTGVKNVTFSLNGTATDGTPVTVKGTTALSFIDYNRCG